LADDLIGNLPALVKQKYSATAVSLDLPTNLGFDEWRTLGAELGRVHRMLGWWIGDWWRFGYHRYGERKHQVETWGGPSFQTCQDYAWVCGCFETSRRREVLSFSHHREVAGLPPEEADEALGWCLEGVAEGNRSVLELREEVRRRKLIRLRQNQATIEVEVTTAPLVFPRFVTRLTAASSPLPLAGIVRQFREPPSPPAIELDTSPGGGPIPPELAALKEEPPVAPDRVEMARAALVVLSFDDAVAILINWYEALPPAQKATIRGALK
jgi:hypothetical protein